jgi:hypothetical protein
MALITWLDKIDGSDAGDPQKNVNAADMNHIKTVVNTNVGLIATVQGEIDAHEALTNNPHSVTKTQVGLPNVDNTSDANKPVSTAQATAIGVVQTDINTHEALINNPHSVTKTQVGLSNVTNEAQLPLTLTANKSVTGDFDLSLGTSGSHLNKLSIYTEEQLFLHAQDDLTINIHAGVGTDVVGVQVTPKQVAIAAGFANSTTVYIRDEDSSNAFEVITNDGSIVLTASPGFNITLNADNIALNGVLTTEVWGEVPTGTINGVNDTFTISYSNPRKIAVYSDGIRTNPANFSVSGTTLTMGATVIPFSTLLTDYIK